MGTSRRTPEGTSRRTPRGSTVLRDGPHVIMRRTKTRSKKAPGSKWSLEWNDESDWAPVMDASWLLAEVSAAVHRAHVTAIAAGELASGGAQRQLDPAGAAGLAARAGRRPDARGVARTDGKSLPDMLTRGAIRASGGAVSRSKAKGTARIGTRATVEIAPARGGHSQFLAKDAARGVEYLFVYGRVEKIIDEALGAWLDVASDVPPDLSTIEFGAIQGRDLR